MNLLEPKEWDRWVSSVKGGDVSTAVLWIKHLLHWERLGWRVDLHKMTRPDEVNKFHTHPAFAWRIILAGGYVEEVVDPISGDLYMQKWLPGNVGLIEPQFCHRIAFLYDGPSYSLWLRGRCTHDIFVGEFWQGEFSLDLVSHVKEDV